MVSSTDYALETYGYFLKLFHVFGGVYIWEFIINVDFEWQVYKGKRPWRWSLIVYIVTRGLALTTFILAFVGFNLTREFDCEVWFHFLVTTGWSAEAFASLLLVLRGVAIWGRDLRIVALAGSLWLANLGGVFYAITRSHAQWSPAFRTCAITDTVEFKWSLVINFIEDFGLLGIMIAGVLHKRGATELWDMLYFQSLFWILAAILAKLPTLILCFRNINDSWNLMFQLPHLVLMVIASTRAYRDLFQYITKGNQNSRPSYRRNESPRTCSVPPSGRDVEITVTKAIECDVELHPRERDPKIPSRMGDEESGSDTPEFTKEEL